MIYVSQRCESDLPMTFLEKWGETIARCLLISLVLGCVALLIAAAVSCSRDDDSCMKLGYPHAVHLNSGAYCVKRGPLGEDVVLKLEGR